jgi:phosphatidylinositol glycan class Q protein
MRTHMGLMRIFWPSDAPRSPSPGVLVGFQNSDSDVFVVGILQQVEVCVHGRDTYRGPY